MDALIVQMSPNLQDHWIWRRMSQEQWHCPGMPPQMRRKMIVCIILLPRGILSSAHGKLWLIASSITNIQSLTSCQEDSITSGSMPRTTWDSLNPASPQPGRSQEKRVSCENQLVFMCHKEATCFLCFKNQMLQTNQSGVYSNIIIWVFPNCIKG